MPFTIHSADISNMHPRTIGFSGHCGEEDADSALREHWSSGETPIHSRVTST